MITVDCMVRTNKNDVVSSTKKFSDRQERNPRKAGKDECDIGQKRIYHATYDL